MKRALLVMAVVLTASSSIFAGTAGANVEDGPEAVASNAADLLAVDDVDADPLCTLVVSGTFVTQHVHYGFGEVYGSDVGDAAASCTSTNFTLYTLTVTVSIQYYDGWQWVDIPGTAGSSTSPALMGTGVGNAVGAGMYERNSPYLNHYHRAVGCVSTSRWSYSRCRPSPTIWFMADLTS